MTSFFFLRSLTSSSRSEIIKLLCSENNETCTLILSKLKIYFFVLAAFLIVQGFEIGRHWSSVLWERTGISIYLNINVGLLIIIILNVDVMSKFDEYDLPWLNLCTDWSNLAINHLNSLFINPDSPLCHLPILLLSFHPYFFGSPSLNSI